MDILLSSVTLYNILPLIQVGSCLAIVALLIKTARRNTVHRLALLFMLGLAALGVINFGSRISPDTETALLWNRWMMPTGALTVAMILHFCVRYTRSKIPRVVLPILYGIVPVILFFSVFTDILLYAVFANLFGYAVPYAIYIFSISTAVLILFIHNYRKSPSQIEKKRTFYLIIGTIFSFMGGIFDFMASKGLPFYPGTVISEIIYCVLFAFAIIKHNLMDIRLVIRRGLIHSLVSLVISIPIIGIILLVHYYFFTVISGIWAYVLILVIAVVLVQPLWQIVQKWVDRIFYRRSYDFLKALENYSRQSEANNIDERVAIMNLISDTLQKSPVYLLQLSEDKHYHVTAASGKGPDTTQIRLASTSSLVIWLQAQTEPVALAELLVLPELHGRITDECSQLKHIGSEMLIPLKASRSGISGVLVLGEKPSKQAYTIEEHRLIVTMSRQIAYKLENSLLYHDAVQSRVQLETWMNSMADCVIIRNQDYSIAFMNTAAQRLFGNYVGRACWEVKNRTERCDKCVPELSEEIIDESNPNITK